MLRRYITFSYLYNLYCDIYHNLSSGKILHDIIVTMKRLHAIFREAKHQEFKKGDIILSPNKKTTAVYQITKGFVVSYTKSEEGKRKIQTILKSGEIFPHFRIV